MFYFIILRNLLYSLWSLVILQTRLYPGGGGATGFDLSKRLLMVVLKVVFSSVTNKVSFL